ncbi:MAG: hypothetical protein RLY50_1401 [Actinomycetota bacterium]
MRRRDPSEPARLSEAIDALLARMHGPDRKAAGSLFSRWQEIVGETVAAHATPVKLADRTLLVEVEDQAWLTQLRFLANDLLTTLRAHTDDAVDAIEFRVRRHR